MADRYVVERSGNAWTVVSPRGVGRRFPTEAEARAHAERWNRWLDEAEAEVTEDDTER